MAFFTDVARLADQLAREGSRLKKRAAITDALLAIVTPGPGSLTEGKETHPEPALSPAYASEAGRFCLYLAGQPFPEADARRLNAGGAILSRSLKEVSGASDSAMTAAYRRHGDLGAGAYDLLVAPYGKAPSEATLTLGDIAAGFDTMAKARTTKVRSATVEELLRRSTPLEAKYLLKLMLGDMRIGVKQSLVEEAIAGVACEAGQTTDVAAVRHAVMLEADLARAVERAFAGTLAEARLTLFHPLGFMLASPVETPEEAVGRFTSKPKKAEAAKLKPKPKPKPKPKLKAKLSRKAAAAERTADLEVSEASEDAAEEYPDLSSTFADAVAQQASTAGLADDVLITAETDGGEIALGEEPPGVESGAAVHAFLEDKFDGIRAQVHCGDPAQVGRVAIYSRSREDITESFPELEEAFREGHAGPGAGDGVRSLGGLILDGEILGWDVSNDRALPFAVLGQRIGRKRVDDEIRRSIPVVFMAFDLMCEGGELMLALPLTERRARLEAIADRLAPVVVSPLSKPAEPRGAQRVLTGLFSEAVLDAAPDAAAKAPPEAQLQEGADAPPGPLSGSAERPLARLRLSRAELVESAEAIDRGYTEARARANEGVMIKAAGSPYLPGRRGLLWVKLKRELGSLDVVITGAEFGSGRRSQVLSDYTFAVRGPQGELLNVGKAYSGVTDAEVLELTEWLKAHTLEDNGHFRTVEPLRVLEVTFNNIMRSERHASGFALRFPRILRVRDDKPVAEIDTLSRVEEIYQSQPDKPEQ